MLILIVLTRSHLLYVCLLRLFFAILIYVLIPQGHANYLMLWGSSCVFLLANVWLIVVLMKLQHRNRSASADVSLGSEAVIISKQYC